MLDISDGLGKDAARLAKASQVRLIIEPSSPVLAEAIEYWRPLARMLEHDPADWVLGGGEDHALLATFPAEAMLPDGWRGIGHVLAAGEGGPGVTIQGAASTAQGWDHFA
jgi:thiamine-monophosphate kinase